MIIDCHKNDLILWVINRMNFYKMREPSNLLIYLKQTTS